jgi:hypothetical protein
MTTETKESFVPGARVRGARLFGSVVEVRETCFAGDVLVQWDDSPPPDPRDNKHWVARKALEVVAAGPDDRIKWRGRWRTRLEIAKRLKLELGRGTTARHDVANARYVLTRGTAQVLLHGFPARVAVLEGS